MAVSTQYPVGAVAPSTTAPPGRPSRRPGTSLSWTTGVPTMQRRFASLTLVLSTLLAADGALANERGGVLGRLGGGNSDRGLAVSAGVDAVRGLTLTDAQLAELGAQAAQAFDRENRVAPASHPQAQRLARLTAGHQGEHGLALNFKVYLDDTLNAFALPDGSIRFYAGLMELMSDDELRFVIGHEIAHVHQGHAKGRFRTAYLAQAARKGVASQGNTAGALAASDLGGVLEELFKAQYSQRNELAADAEGLAFLRRHGHTEAAAVSALQKLAGHGGRGADAFSSHPDADRRAQRMQRQVARR